MLIAQCQDGGHKKITSNSRKLGLQGLGQLLYGGHVVRLQGQRCCKRPRRRPLQGSVEMLTLEYCQFQFRGANAGLQKETNDRIRNKSQARRPHITALLLRMSIRVSQRRFSTGESPTSPISRWIYISENRVGIHFNSRCI